MSSEVDPQNALRALRKVQQSSKGHKRLRASEQEKNSSQMRALEGICGECVNIRPFLYRSKPHDTVALGCRRDFSPINLYRNTPLGEKAFCPGFQRKR